MLTVNYCPLSSVPSLPPTAKLVDLSDNAISSVPASAGGPGLASLDLAGNLLQDAALPALGDVAGRAPGLRHLALGCNYLSAGGVEELQERCRLKVCMD
ncbi:hypothetical protein TeGR_g2416 [Tetraparma gracilis]|uniref:Uncharacterized protein n=1 Tax=Tetraparma gracilis TaxID=2962635 RepID=A0ABQ6N3I6_9STRA|nr:hypothetical protein TeGR_g2416 [Tetraparma gracilis]